LTGSVEGIRALRVFIFLPKLGVNVRRFDVDSRKNRLQVSLDQFLELLRIAFVHRSVVYGQMYSNALLSRITNTKPGELGLDFWVRLGTFVFVPLLSLLSLQFPELNNFFFFRLQPALQSIK
jgi:hypothetical protein